MAQPYKPLKGIELQQKKLSQAIKPTTDPLKQKQNEYKFAKLQQLQTPTTVAPVRPTTTPQAAPGTTSGTTLTAGGTDQTNKTSVSGTPVVNPIDDKLKPGQVRDPATGKIYSATSVKGKELLAGGASVGAEAPVAEEPVATYAEIGAANIQADYDANLAAELDLFGEKTGYSSMDEYIQDQKKAQDEQADLQRRQLELQKTQIGEQVGDQKNIIEGQVEAASGLVGSREGVTSQSNLSAYGRLKEASSVQISRLQRDRDMSFKAIEQAKVDLARAERAGNTQLAKQYRSTLLAAESAAQATETDYINALTMASEEERNVQAQENANLTTFTELVGNGTELTPDAINNYATTLGLDFQTAYDYYTGAQAIRDDKTLSVEEKQIANATNQKALDDALAGIQTAQAQNIDYLNQQTQVWAGQGFSEEEISQKRSELRQMLGIENEDDPGYQAEIAYKLAETNYKDSATATNLQALIEARAALDNNGGVSGGYLPANDGVYTVSRNDDGSLSVDVVDGQSLDLPGTERREDWCAAFVNDVLGTAFGDTFADKLSYAKENGFSDTPEVGMAFLQETSSIYGHVGIIESIDWANGEMDVVDANWQKGEDGKGIIDRRTMKISDAAGFMLPEDSIGYKGNNANLQVEVFSYLDATPTEKGEIRDLAVKGGYINDLMAAESGLYGDLLTDPEEAKLAEVMNSLYSSNITMGKKKAFQVYQAIVNGNDEQAWSLVRSGFNESLTAEEGKDFNGRNEAIAALESVKGLFTDETISDYIGDKTGFLAGGLSSLKEDLGMRTDLSEVEVKVQAALQAYTNAVSGAAFTEQEFERYQNVFPEITNLDELNEARITSLLAVMETNQNGLINTKTGGRFKSYDSLWGDQTVSESLGNEDFIEVLTTVEDNNTNGRYQ